MPGGTLLVVSERAEKRPVPVLADTSFVGRTLQVISDLNRTERLYLFEHARRLKRAIRLRDQDAMEEFRIGDPDLGLYEVFLEDSTRTRESFKNAAEFHHIKSLELNAASSSFNKAESYADTFANLIGYDNRIFVVRSKLEGVCRHLAEHTAEYIGRHGFPEWVSFINAGDGRHEHPTQELLDEFTFLEDLRWSARSIHLAMVGDLYHGRTVHSKVCGLSLFENARVDLVAPPELAMPRNYVQTMTGQGFDVREFESIDEYLECGDVAPQWYFTRPQIERMGERVLQHRARLQSAITFRMELMDRLAPGTIFYHPLPRHREHPTIPPALDSTMLNGWERQSANGWVVRIVLLSLLAGRIGADYSGPVGPDDWKETGTEFVTEVSPPASGPKHYSEGVRPITDGVVIDHISVGGTPQSIRAHTRTILSVLEFTGRGGEWISEGSDGRLKGLVFRPGHAPLDRSQIRRLAAVAPGATVNIINEGSIVGKYRLAMPSVIYGMEDLICRNESCITNPVNHEPVNPTFRKSNETQYSCEYCDTEYSFTEIWR